MLQELIYAVLGIIAMLGSIVIFATVMEVLDNE